MSEGPADKYAERYGLACDYCGAKTGLERWESPRTMDDGLRCVDGVACNEREVAAWEDDD